MTPTNELSRFLPAGQSTAPIKELLMKIESTETQLASNGFLARGFVSIAVLFSLNAGPSAAAVVVPPGELVVGQTQLALAEQWTQWALGIPAATNPIADLDGGFAQINNNGNVFFLAGNFGGPGFPPRTISVPFGKPLFFPVLNAFDVEWPSGTHTTAAFPTCFDPPGTSESDALVCAKNALAPYQIGSATDLYAKLDGVTLVTNVPSFRQTSSAFFDLTLPDDNLFSIYGLDAGDDYKGITDGYWLALKDLSPGEHTLEFGGVFNYADGTTNKLSVIDNLKVVPEPRTLLLLLPALFALTAVKRRKAW